jgi:hypothetical protein
MPTFLLKERVVRSDGSGPVIELGPDVGKLHVLTLGITRIVEHQSLEVSVWGSADGEDWGHYPVARYPQKLYCGLYSTLLNLSAHPAVRFLRVQWKGHRLSKNDSTPLFGFYAYLEESGARIAAAVA